MAAAATLGPTVERAVATHPHREAYVEGARRTTYAEWLERADAVAAGWQARGVRPGDVVAIALASSTDFAIAYLAAVRLGAVVTALNTRLGPREVDHIMATCSPALVVADVADMPAVGGALSVHDPDPADPAVIVWTSGSTGCPKGVWFDHCGQAALARMSGVLSAPGDRRVLPFPMAHAGYMVRVWDQAEHGITNVIPEGAWSAEAMLATLVDERITVGQGVPTQWAKLVELPALADADLSALRVCATGAAPVAPELAAAMVARLACPVIVRYACSELPILAGTAPGDPPEVLLRTVGRPAEGVEIELRDVRDGVGVITVRSAGAMRGYWGQPDSDPALRDGWITMGDLARWDADSNLVLCGRTTEMYIRGGYNVYPLEVQRVLEEHPGVAEAAVYGAEAPVIGQIGVACVVPVDADAPPSLDELRQFVAAQLADYKAPDELRVLSELPRNAMGKVDTLALRGRTS